MAEAEIFATYRPLLFGLAYRMLGSAMDAEDIVQESFLRWQQTAGGTVETPRAYLTTVVTRLCIDHLRSARVRREEYIGPWLPEPLVGTPPGEERTPDLADSLSLAFLVLLETLTPAERAVFLLHDVFGYAYAEIAPIIGKSDPACRQIGARARRRVDERRPRFDASPAQHERLLQRFVQTCATGDMDTLVALLADDVTVWTDGGGRVSAALRPIHGASRAARFLLGVLAKAPPTLATRFATVNGRPGVVIEIDGRVSHVLTIDGADERITAVRIVANPEKLRRLTPPRPQTPDDMTEPHG